ncbi:MAG: SEL1-like repeat protein [Sphingomonadales bacterium]|nr:SEL1-like repeat protein [Sphingomonadales bacterium]
MSIPFLDALACRGEAGWRQSVLRWRFSQAERQWPSARLMQTRRLPQRPYGPTMPATTHLTEMILPLRCTNSRLHATGALPKGASVSGRSTAWAKASRRTTSARPSCMARPVTGGSIRACYNLGLLYQRGTGVAQNIGTAISYWTKACNAGHASGCYMVAAMYKGHRRRAESCHRCFLFCQGLRCRRC